jgi:hypothetical protein
LQTLLPNDATGSKRESENKLLRESSEHGEVIK